MLHPIGYRPGELHRTPNPAALFLDAYNQVLESDQQTQEFLDAQAALARWYALARTQPAAIELRDDVGFFNQLAAEVRKITRRPTPRRARRPSRRCASSSPRASPPARSSTSSASPTRTDRRSRCSPTSSSTRSPRRPSTETSRSGCWRSCSTTRSGPDARQPDAGQALQRGDRGRCCAATSSKQLTSAEVVERLVEIAKQLRDARHRHEQLGLSEEEAAFYDALAGGVEDVKADPELAAIAHELVESIRARPHRRLGRPRGHRGEDPRARSSACCAAHSYEPPKAKAAGAGGGRRAARPQLLHRSSSSTRPRRSTATGPRSATGCSLRSGDDDSDLGFKVRTSRPTCHRVRTRQPPG